MRYLSKASEPLGKIPAHIRKSKLAALSDYYITGKSTYYPRMANTVLHTMDYIDLSAEKLFFKHRKVRALADFEEKRRLEEPDPPLLPRQPMIHKGSITPFPQKPSSDVIAAGLREIHRHSSLPTSAKQPRSPRTVSSRQPKAAREFMSISGRTLGRRAKTSLPATRSRPAKLSYRSDRSSASSRPRSAIDHKLSIRVDKEYMEVLRDHQRINFRIHKHFDPDKNPLDDKDFSTVRYRFMRKTNLTQRLCRCAGKKDNPCVNLSTTQWLSFSGIEFDPKKAGHVVDAFTTSMEPFQECYTIEQSTGCVVAHQMSAKDRKIIVGINGQAVPGHLSAMEQATLKSTNFYDEPPVPLSWNDMLKKSGVKCVDARTPKPQSKSKESEKTPSERRLVWFKKDNPAESRRPRICEKSSKDILREQDILNTTRQTRALERSPYTKIIDPQVQRSKSATEKMKDNDCLSYDDVVEILKLQAEKTAKSHRMSGDINQHNVNAFESHQRDSSDPSSWDIGFSRGSSGTPQSTPRRYSPLAPSGSGLAKPMSSNSFRPRKDDLQLTLRSEDRRGFVTERQSIEKSTPSTRNGRLHTGNILHKTCAAQGSSVGRDPRADVAGEEQESAAFISFVNPLIRPPHMPPRHQTRSDIEHIHEVATSMVLERSIESRTEYTEPRHYPNTPVSQPYDDYLSTSGHTEDVTDENCEEENQLRLDSDRPPSEQEEAVAETSWLVNSSSSDIQELVEKSDEADKETPPTHSCAGATVSIPTAD